MTSSRTDSTAHASTDTTSRRVRSPIAPMHGEPRVSSAQISQALAGHALEVIEPRGDWLLVRGEDGYEGWVHAGYLAPAADTEPSVALRVSLGCTVREDELTRPLPLGALVLPDERLASGEALSLDGELARRFPPGNASSVVRAATTLFAGTSYQWGGVTPWGADCSGFVQAIYRLHGRRLPRDAWQQALEGVDGGNDPETVAAGGLLFFSDREDGRITHVGVALGRKRMAHIALGRGGFAIEDLSDRRDGYIDALHGRFRGARLVLG